MQISKADILASLADPISTKLTAAEWRTLTARYPATEIFVWHYLRALYQADDIDFEPELNRLGLRISDRQQFYNFLTARPARAAIAVMPATGDYYGTATSAEPSDSLRQLARKLRAARIAAQEAEARPTIATAENQREAGRQAIELIREKKFNQALEILKQIDLAKSEKSSYFALQIKYLETITKNNK